MVSQPHPEAHQLLPFKQIKNVDVNAVSRKLFSPIWPSMKHSLFLIKTSGTRVTVTDRKEVFFPLNPLNTTAVTGGLPACARISDQD